MADFTPIMTQAEFDAAIAERLSRQEKSIAARYEGAMPKTEADALRQGYESTIAELNGQIKTAAQQKAESDRQLTEMTAKLRGYETDSVKTRIALEMGLPYQMGARLTGDTEDAIRKDAEALRGMLRQAAPQAPLAAEPTGGSNVWANLAEKLGG